MNILDFLFPIRSLLGNEGTWITEEERRSMRLFPVRIDRHELQKRGLPSIDCIIAAGSYSSSPLLKRAIHTFKYRGVHAIAPELGRKIAEALPGLLMIPEKYRNPPPVLCPVPLHWTRRFRRGFNQAELIARELSKSTGWRVEGLLRRTRPTGHQAHRHRDERLGAMKSAFAIIHGETTPPPCVLLVDDIVTTGSTLEACAETLKKAGVKYIVGLVVAHG
jgi:ComF family protein